MNKAVDDDVTGACGRIVPFTFHDNMFAGLNFSIATRAAAGEVGEESLSVFSNGVWPVVMWVKRAHRELVKPMMGSYEPPLA